MIINIFNLKSLNEFVSLKSPPANECIVTSTWVEIINSRIVSAFATVAVTTVAMETDSKWGGWFGVRRTHSSTTLVRNDISHHDKS